MRSFFFLRQNLKACKLTTFTVFTDSTSMFSEGKVGQNPSLLELLVLETMDRVSYWRQIHYHRNLVRLTLLDIMKHTQLAPVNSEQ